MKYIHSIEFNGYHIYILKRLCDSLTCELIMQCRHVLPLQSVVLILAPLSRRYSAMSLSSSPAAMNRGVCECAFRVSHGKFSWNTILCIKHCQIPFPNLFTDLSQWWHIPPVWFGICEVNVVNINCRPIKIFKHIFTHLVDALLYNLCLSRDKSLICPWIEVIILFDNGLILETSYLLSLFGSPISYVT